MRWHPKLVERNRNIVKARAKGMPVTEIAEKFSITPARVYQICGTGSEKQTKKSHWRPVEFAIVTQEQKAYDLKRVAPYRSWDNIAELLKYDNGKAAYRAALNYAQRTNNHFPADPAI